MTAPKDAFRAESLWWRMYRVVEAVSESPVVRGELTRALFGAIEQQYFGRVRSLRGGDAAELRRCTDEQLVDVGLVLDHLEREWQLEPVA